MTLNMGHLLHWSCLSLEVWGELLPPFTNVLRQCSRTSGTNRTLQQWAGSDAGYRFYYCVHQSLPSEVLAHHPPISSGLHQAQLTLCSGVSRIFVRGVLSFGLLYDYACVNPKRYPWLRFPNAPGSASGCSFINVWRWSGVWRHVL